MGKMTRTQKIIARNKTAIEALKQQRKVAAAIPAKEAPCTK
jgi:ribosomal protein S18